MTSFRPRPGLGSDNNPSRSLLALDSLMFKAAGANIESMFTNMERRMFQELGRTWLDRADDAVDILNHITGDGMATQADVKRIAAHVEGAFQGWDDDVQDMVEAVTEQAYQQGKRQIRLRALGRVGPVKPDATPHMDLTAIRKGPKIEVNPSFTLADERAVATLSRNQLHWIGEHYSDNMSERINQLVQQHMVESGLGRREASKILRAALEVELAMTTGESAVPGLPKGWMGRPDQYWEGIAGNTVTNARSHGAMRSMSEIGVTHYTIVAALDERSCKRCVFQDGKSFTVESGIARMEAVLAAETPDELKAAHPWAKNVEQIEADPERYSLPPLHFRCRCTVDISEDSELSFD